MVTKQNSMATMNAPTKLTQMNSPAKPAQIRVARRSPAYWRVTNRPDQAPPQHQPAAGCRARRRVGCVHCFAWATCRTKRNQSADRARLPQAGGCRKSARILPGTNLAVGPRVRRVSDRTLRMGRARSQACLPGHGRKIGNEKRPARN